MVTNTLRPTLYYVPYNLYMCIEVAYCRSSLHRVHATYIEERYYNILLRHARPPMGMGWLLRLVRVRVGHRIQHFGVVIA